MTTTTHEGYVTKAWLHTLDDGRDIACFTLDGSPGAFWGSTDWLPLLDEAIKLRTWCRVKDDVPDPERCTDPLCGDGCCDDPDCTNVPAHEWQRPYLVRADTIEWL